MSNAYLKWARGVRGIKRADRAVLQDIADRVGDDGSWLIRMNELAATAEVSRNTLRATLDRLAAHGLLVFKAEAYKGAAQGFHRFALLRNEDERRAAEAKGFSTSRKAMDRGTKPSDEVGQKLTEGGGSKTDRGLGQKLTEGGSNSCPRVGQLFDPLSTPQEPLKKKECPKPEKPVRSRHSYPEDFERFWAAYPTDPIMSKVEAGKAWSKLTEADRKAAAAAVAPYRRYCAENAWYRTKHARNFLSQRVFDGFTRHAPQSVSSDDPLVDLPGGIRRRWSFLQAAVADWRRDPKSWPEVEIGPPPDRPTCWLPKAMLRELEAA